MTTCVILQSNYIPWKGYFQLISKADVFVFYDIVQYTKGDWRHRNRIMTFNGPTWLTIPIKKGPTRRIDQVILPEGNWRTSHPNTVRHSYRKTAYQKDAIDILNRRLTDDSIMMLSDLNQMLIKDITNYLQLNVEFINSKDLKPEGQRVDRLLDICEKVGADTYLSGPSAKDYITDEFDGSPIELEWIDYGPFPEYDQIGPEFNHNLSILDLIAHLGPDARKHIII